MSLDQFQDVTTATFDDGDGLYICTDGCRSGEEWHDTRGNEDSYEWVGRDGDLSPLCPTHKQRMRSHDEYERDAWRPEDDY